MFPFLRSRSFSTVVNPRFRPYDEARAWAHSLRLQRVSDWWSLGARNRPSDIPSNPHQTYGKEFISWYDWLGKATRSAAGRASDRILPKWTLSMDFSRTSALREVLSLWIAKKSNIRNEHVYQINVCRYPWDPLGRILSAWLFGVINRSVYPLGRTYERDHSICLLDRTSRDEYTEILIIHNTVGHHSIATKIKITIAILVAVGLL